MLIRINGWYAWTNDNMQSYRIPATDGIYKQILQGISDVFEGLSFDNKGNIEFLYFRRA